ncbi:molybdenum cofactor biosynthesis protein MoaE [Paenibacillus sp. FJAT-26967]|uniref:molybdenum cofactor biosynthesis protein n=1 Tax=Paenibacillus sp. FJAT-26967 TaxID=1729690 RepID=UPI000837EA42|nr:molybdenum cofactor biosynthesis protein MoaE [Paenibacillus sp. FJAT-26967]
MTFRIRLFAGLADVLGRPFVDLSIDEKTAGGSDTVKVQQLLEEMSRQFPEAGSLLAHCFLAKNHTYAAPEEPVAVTDELALIPPVSGGSGKDRSANKEKEAEDSSPYALTRSPIDADQVAARTAHPDCGATLLFIGTTREHTDGQRTVLLEYEAYEPMALITMRTIGEEIAGRWPGARCAMTHRLGPVAIGESSLVIAVSTPHRAACYEASRYAIERVKQILPVWKKEIHEDGSEWKGYASGEWNPLDPVLK